MEPIETLNKSVKLQSDGKVSVDASDHADDLLDVGYMEYGYVRGCLLVLFFSFPNLFPSSFHYTNITNVKILIADVSIISEDAELEHHVVMRYLTATIVIMKQW